jgi:hypothetical protein
MAGTKPNKGTPADKRKAGNGGSKPGPKQGSKNKPKAVAESPFRITAKSWLPGAPWSLSGATDAYVVEADTVMDA